MSLPELITRLESRGVRVRAEAGELRVQAPKGALDHELRAELARHKRELLAFITALSAPGEEAPIARAPRAGELPLSFAQERLWFLDQLRPGAAIYTLAFAWRAPVVLDPRQVEHALLLVIARHEVLRTRLPSSAGKPRQLVEGRGRLPFLHVELGALGEARRERELQRLVDDAALGTWDLAAGPLVRALVVATGAGSALLVSFHHAIFDAWSVAIFLRELETSHAALAREPLAREPLAREPLAAGLAPELPPLPIQYADFALWQRRRLAGQRLAALLGYWRHELEGLGELELPNDRPRPAAASFAGRALRTPVAGTTRAALAALGRAHGATPFMVVLAALTTLLHRLSGQSDLAVGAPVANRTESQTQDLIGFFVNTLVLRSRASARESLRDRVAAMRERVLGAQAHQELPFERLVEELVPQRDLARNPLFQVLCTLQSAPAKTPRLGGAGLESLRFTVRRVRLDLEVHVAETDAGWDLTLLYATDLLDATTVRRWSRALVRVLETVAADPALRLGELPLLAAAERHQLLAEASDSVAFYPREPGLAALVRHGTTEAVVWRHPDGTREALPWAELETLSTRLARRLIARGVRRGDLVAVEMERGPATLAAFLAILKTGAAYLPLDPSYPPERRAFMLDDARPRLVLSPSDLALDDAPDAPLPHVAGGDDLAYVIYTSGSTGRPKGVAVTQRAVARLVLGTDYLELRGDDRIAQVSSTSFDAATFEIWGALLHGATLVGIPNETLLSPRALAATLAEEKVSVLSITMVLFHQLAREKPETFCGLRALLFGAEAAEIRWVRAVRETFSGRMVHLYGPTECTGFATWQRVDRPPESTLPIGRPLANTEALVLDRWGAPAPLGVLGELLLGGDGLAWGYLARPAITAERFVPHPFAHSPGARLYRTGDLVRRLAGGELLFSGRIDHQVKIRGFRVEPGEVETVLAEHPAVKAAAVVVRGAGADKQLVAWVVAAEEEVAAIETHLRARLPAHLVPAFVIALEALPQTPTGKLDRVALASREPAAETPRRAPDTAPRTPQEEILCAVFAQVLGRERVGIFEDFFALGGHSLLATQAVTRAATALGVEVSLRALFESPTAAGLAERLARGAGAAPPGAIPRLPRRDGRPELEPPLSFAQERLWLIDRLVAGQSGFYNVALAWRLDGPLSVPVLAACLREVARRHEVLRTTFPTREGRAVQQVSPEPALPFAHVDLTRLRPAARRGATARLRAAVAERPFDLERGPLARAVCAVLGERERILACTFHHVVCDGWSHGVLSRELRALYPALAAGRPSPLPELDVQYADFAVWQRGHLDGAVLERQLAFWRAQLEDAPRLELPIDRPRPAVQRFCGATLPVRLGEPIHRALLALGRGAGATLFMTLLAGWKTLLRHWTGHCDLVVGTPIAGRNQPQIEPLIGFFVNSLVLRTPLGGDPPWTELLAAVRERTLAAFGHQDLPFEKLVEQLHPERDLTRNPIFQVMFALHNAVVPRLELGEAVLEPILAKVRSTRFDLEATFWEGQGGLGGALVFDRDLFDPTTIHRLAAKLGGLLAALPETPERRLSQLPLLAASERHQLVVEPNDTAAAYPRGAGLAALFTRSVARDPRAPALVFPRVGAATVRLSYGELDRRANRLAHRLIALGAGPETLVALAIERGPTALWAILAIVKTGAAYLPLDPAHPEHRLAAMIADARPAVLLTDRAPGEALHAGAGRILELDLAADDDAHARAGERDDDPRAAVGGEHLAYVMFTSGSTGRPKGVMVTQGAIARLVLGTNYTRLGPDDRIAQVSNLSFDASTFEIWGAWLCGGCLVGVPTDVLLTPRLCERWIAEQAITVLSVTMGPFHLTAREHPAAWAGARQVFFGAEAADARLVAAVRAAIPGRLVHLYGPTESTSFATWHAVTTPGEEKLPIGRALANTRVVLLDTLLEPVPLGTPGEIHLGGDGLARGYLNRPAITAERFVPDPTRTEPGARLYKTGDLARRRTAGELEFLGRIDTQFKVRGFRIEPGEIEAALAEHPAVVAAAVVVREVAPGERQLVACVVDDPSRQPDTAAAEPAWQSEQVEQWQLLFDDAYARGEASTFNTTGWKHTASGAPIAAEMMREWLDDTVAAIRALAPRRVLEIGCGTGMVLFEVAPGCELYVGTDVARQALELIATQRRRLPGGLPQVRLEQRAAHDFSGLEPGGFDLVVLNSVIQYFPAAEYLVAVLQGALAVLAPGGAVLVGDVRSLPLAELFHAEVALARAEDATPRAQLLQTVQTALLEEDELLVDPGLFFALAARSPGVSGVEVRPKRARHHHELSRYRYQVVLHTADPPAPPEPGWLDWERAGLTLERLRQKLVAEKPATLALTGIPNARLAAPLAALAALYAEDGPADAAELRRRLAEHAPAGIDPEQLRALAGELPYEIMLSWAGHGGDGRLHAFLRRRGHAAAEPRPPLPALDPDRPWSSFTSRPLRGRHARRRIPELRAHLAARLPEHMVPALFVLLDALPLTPNGKLDRAALGRRALPALAAPVRGRARGTAPRTAEERELAAIWAEVLGVPSVGIEEDFFALGGHSLAATRVISRVRARLGVELPLRVLFQEPTVGALAKALTKALAQTLASAPGARRLPPIAPAARAEEGMPPTFAQERLWFLDRLTPGGTAYLSPVVWRLEGRLEVAALAASLGEVTRRHEVLRTTLEPRSGRPVQVIHPPGGFCLPVVDLGALADPEPEARRLSARATTRPFDLAAEPPLRALLVRLGEETALLAVLLHHVAVDGWSHGVLARELCALYAAAAGARGRSVRSPLPELAVQMADVAVWQRRWLAGEELEHQLGYWREQLAEAPATELPGDRPRPPVQRFRGGLWLFPLAPTPEHDPRGFARARGLTLFQVALAAFQALLHRLTGGPDVTVGTPIAGRNRRELEPLIGFFVNMLVLRSRLDGEHDPSFELLLERTVQTTLAALEHQDLPFEKLVEHLGLARDLTRNPLFQLFFAVETLPAARLGMGDVSLEHVPLEIRATRFDLELQVWQRDAELWGMVVWDSDLFDPTTVRRWCAGFARLLAAGVAAPARRLSQLPVLDRAERHQLLAEDNDTATTGHDSHDGHDADAVGIHQVFAHRAAASPDAVALVAEDAQLSYAELAARARRLAQRLRARGVGADDVVALAIPRSPEMVVAMLGVLGAGAAYLPIDPEHPKERIDFLLRQSGARCLLNRADVLEPAALDQPLGWLAAAGHLESRAYVLYTSGSTGEPKGVEIPHRALLGFLALADRVYGLGPGDRVLQFAAPTFDTSVEEIFPALCRGATLVLRPSGHVELPADFLRRAARHRLSVLDLPTAYWHELAAWPELVLPATVRLVIVGGEKAEGGALERWRGRVSERVRLFNGYGPTEATIVATGTDLAAPGDPPGGDPSIGRPLADVEVYLLDRRLEPVAPGMPGEIAIAGAGLARGYLARPAATAERFVPEPWSGRRGARLYKTGDLARRRGDGLLAFAGRIDAQVKLRGIRIEPGEIEAVLARHPAVEAAAVVVHTPADGNPQLVAWVVAAAGEISAVESHLRARLPAHLVPAFVVAVGELPRTASGKVHRTELARREPDTRAPQRALTAAPRTPQEEILVEIFQRVLGRRDVGILDGFFELGGHSLAATQAVAQARELLGIELPLRALFETPTVAALAERLAERLAELDETASERLPPAPRIVPQPRIEGAQSRFPLTFSQLREWILDRLDPGSTAYVIASPFWLRGALDVGALAWAMERLIHRHEALRTRFAEVEEGGEPVQVVLPPTPVPLPVIDLGGLAAADREREAKHRLDRELARGFELTREPLVRSRLVRLDAREHLWLLSFHHSIFDGWSTALFFDQLDTLYRTRDAARAGAAPVVQYADFAVWQRRWLSGEVLERIAAFWRRTLAGAPPLVELPLDRPRPREREHRAGMFFERLPATLAAALPARARAERATLFIVLLAGLDALLLRLTGRGDLTIGTFIANRNRAETAGVIGFFTNTLVLRTVLEPDATARRAIAAARETALGAYAHQDLPFEKLLEVVAVERNPAFTPLFQVMLTLHNLPQSAPRLGTLELAHAALGTRQADFDLELTVHPVGSELVVEVKHAAALFDTTTVRRLVRGWRALLAAVAARPETRLCELPLLAAEERHQLVVESNDTAAGVSDRAGATVLEVFARQAARTPRALALVGNAGEELSYAELAARVHRLARRLRRLGIGPETVVALALPRSVEMIVALLAVLETGAAYVPIDPEQPAERIAFLRRQSGARLCLDRIDALEEEARDEPAEPLGLEIHPETRAYVMYTSGSTGEPKGVVIPHRALANFLTVTDSTYGYGPGDRVLQFAALGFDTSVEEIFPALCRGATLVLRPAERVETPGDFLRRAAERALTAIDLPTAYWHELAAFPELRLPETVRLVIVGGEKAAAEALARWRHRVDARVRLFNGYGPTEATVIAIGCDLAGPGSLEDPSHIPPIGRPLANARIYLLDPRLVPVPWGVRGEIAIGGPGLARGYLGRPAATAERFVPEPWSGEPGARLYKTGDVARRRADGAMELIGRVDDQVKLRGLRVEPGEVGAVLAGHPALEQAVVLARPLAAGELGLVAYVVAREGSAVSSTELRGFLKTRLPEFLVPAVFVPLAALPMSASNKVDRKALARMPLPATGPAATATAPRSELERGLARIWAEVLGREQVGVEESFFDLGGNSLLILRLHRRLEEAGHAIKVLDLFRHPTVRALAAELVPRPEPARFETAKNLAERQRAARVRRRPDRPPARR